MAAPLAGRRLPAPPLTPVPAARFDDLVAGCATELDGFRSALVARHPHEVVPVLARVEEHAAAGRWVAGFVAYEAAAGLDPALAVDPPAGPGDGTPLAWFGVFARRRPAAALTPSPPGGPTPDWNLDTGPAEHAALVGRIRDHIEAGDVYQCNLTARYRAGLEGDPFALYRDLALAQGGGHCAFVDTGEVAVACASPELFFERRGDVVTTRPMKGTARRGRWPAEDDAAGTALAASAKDRAENVMIVDLLRNDLGRVAAFGTVAVPALWTLERYPTVFQLTSTVTARVRPGTSLVDLFGALFPSGSVTGAPKRRAMQLIAEVEASPRGVYCGAVGLVGPDGARFSVAIRTAVVDRRRGTAVYGAGGGIVWDSEPAAEYAELASKAAVLARRPEPFSLLETMAFEPGSGIARWAGHCDRLAASARYHGVPLDLAAVEEAVRQGCAHATTRPGRGHPGRWRVRLLVDRSGTPTVEAHPMEEPGSAPVRLAVDFEPVDPFDAALFHKTDSRRCYEERAERHPDADQVVLVNTRGEVTETTVANLAVKLGGRWWTPPLSSGCLPGVAREEMVRSGRIAERPLLVEELATAQALAVVSSVRGWRPAVLVC